jgi:hypothetical protein
MTAQTARAKRRSQGFMAIGFDSMGVSFVVNSGKRF